MEIIDSYIKDKCIKHKENYIDQYYYKYSYKYKILNTIYKISYKHKQKQKQRQKANEIEYSISYTKNINTGKNNKIILLIFNRFIYDGIINNSYFFKYSIKNSNIIYKQTGYNIIYKVNFIDNIKFKTKYSDKLINKIKNKLIWVPVLSGSDNTGPDNTVPDYIKFNYLFGFNKIYIIRSIKFINKKFPYCIFIIDYKFLHMYL